MAICKIGVWKKAYFDATGVIHYILLIFNFNVLWQIYLFTLND
jgi:hypothetical protein